ncbi:MAG: diguanylate cyclase [Thiotrichales bacterium]|nr:diguanylate cyclase [Thiotrichales bacterium]
MSFNIITPKNIKLIGTIVGILVVYIFATAQQLVLSNEIKPTSYIIPTIVGGLSGFLIAFWFSKLTEAKQQIENSHNRLKLVLEGTETGLWDWNLQTNELIFDEQWCRLLGHELAEVPPVLDSWKCRVHPDDLEQCYIDINRHLSGETHFYSNIHRMKHKQGHWVYILDRGRVLERDKGNQPVRFTGTHTDISHLKEIENALEKSNRELKKLSLKDGLTGLYNRRALDEHLDQDWGHWERNQIPISTLMVDIDLFKQFNDHYGHIAGDECLKQVANVLASSVKRANDMAARYGGEEFLIILSGITQSQANGIAQDIHEKIEQLAIAHQASTLSNKVTVSIGINSCDTEHPCPSHEALIDGADKALYQAKQQGRNQTVLYQEFENSPHKI